MNLAALAPKTVADLRRRDLAFIHVAKKQLGLTEESYRDLIRRFAEDRTESAGDLSVTERIALMNHLRALGAGRVKAKGRGADNREQTSKLRALWRSLYHLGEVEHPSDASLAAFVCRQTGIEALRWNRPSDLNAGIEALKGWCARIGYVPRSSTVQGPMFGRFEPALILAQWERLRLDPGEDTLMDWLRVNFGESTANFLSVEQSHDAVRRLGALLRRQKAKVAPA